jgi:hypothetical protein
VEDLRQAHFDLPDRQTPVVAGGTILGPPWQRNPQPVVARLESGRVRPSMRTLERLAEATGSRLLISFEPREGKPNRKSGT